VVQSHLMQHDFFKDYTVRKFHSEAYLSVTSAFE